MEINEVKTEFVPVDTFARLSGLGRDHIRQMARNGELPIYRVGTAKYVNVPMGMAVLRGKVEGPASAIGGSKQ